MQGQVIRLVSIETRRMSDLAPGTSAPWLVGVSADAPSPGTVTVQLSATGDAGLGLLYDVQTCAVRWIEDACLEAQTLLPEQPIPLDGAERDVLSMAADQTRWLRILVTRPADADPEASGAVDIVVRATGVGDDVATSPERPLAPTGAVAPWALGGFAAVLVAIGAGLLVRARRSP